jgi:predicted phosphodiesterase
LAPGQPFRGATNGLHLSYLSPMRPVTWLHISDLHLRTGTAWEQDVVLRALCDDVAQRANVTTIDFVLVNGDIAFSGNAAEYLLAETFFEAVGTAAHVAKERIFTVPGNHDIDRDRQQLAFYGARAFLRDTTHVDLLLGPTRREDLATLLQRETGYRALQATFFGAQPRLATPDGLGYVASISLDHIRIALVALDSAWSADGGPDDHGKLVLGERQVIDALSIVRTLTPAPHVVVAMCHHPLHLLQDFDRVSVHSRLDAACQFLHCGHLHRIEHRTTGHSPSDCVTIGAGASFETRTTHNSYALVTLDLLEATRGIQEGQYNPSDGRFHDGQRHTFPLSVPPPRGCSLELLTAAARVHAPVCSTFATYLAALLLGHKSDFPIIYEGTLSLASRAVLEVSPPSPLRDATLALGRTRNALSLLYPQLALEDILHHHGSQVRDFATLLAAASARHPQVAQALASIESGSRLLPAVVDNATRTSPTVELLATLAEAADWQTLEVHARRHITSPLEGVALAAQRGLARALAHSHDLNRQRDGIAIYEQLIRTSPRSSDHAELAALLFTVQDYSAARDAVLRGIAACPIEASGQLLELGQRLVAATGDRNLRKHLDTLVRRDS